MGEAGCERREAGRWGGGQIWYNDNMMWRNMRKSVVLLLAAATLLAACAAPPPDAPATITTPADAGSPAPTAAAETDLLPAEEPPADAEREFRTDFSRHTVPYSEILSGGVPKDGIPAIDAPAFISVAQATWLAPLEPVVRVTVGDSARAYPLQILTWHELVNDTLDGMPLVVSFCPLCNTAIVFERTVNGLVLDFGTTGRLRYSNLIMYDRQTETWWQQATGEGIAGQLAGTQLTFYPADLIAWEDFQAAHPQGEVLSRDTGHQRTYGQNPYAGYDNINASPFLYEGPPTPGTLSAMERVLTIERGGEAVAYAFRVLEQERVINDTVGDQAVAVFWTPGTASALDTGTLAEGRDVGSAAAYSREFDGQTLHFTFTGEQIVDDTTGSTWNQHGQAVSGDLAGAQLDPVVAINHFWFSWAAFKPDTRVYQP